MADSKHTPEWIEGVNEILEDMKNAEFSSTGNIVCLAPVEFASSMEHWERRRALIASAPSLLSENQQLRKEVEELKVQLNSRYGGGFSEEEITSLALNNKVKKLREALENIAHHEPEETHLDEWVEAAAYKLVKQIAMAALSRNTKPQAE